jgi:hypothetical protein
MIRISRKGTSRRPVIVAGPWALKTNAASGAICTKQGYSGRQASGAGNALPRPLVFAEGLPAFDAGGHPARSRMRMHVAGVANPKGVGHE